MFSSCHISREQEIEKKKSVVFKTGPAAFGPVPDLSSCYG